MSLFYAIKVGDRILPERFTTSNSAIASMRLLNETNEPTTKIIIVNEAGVEMIMLDGNLPGDDSPLFG
jgi:hypothetical protein